MQPVFFTTHEKFREWLKKNHDKKTELLVGFYKVGSGKPSLTWPQSVDAALSFGWIDGVRKSMGDESYTIRFTPRKNPSIWSAVNIKKIAALKKSGLLMPSGLAAFKHRKEDKSKVYAYEKKPVDLDPSFIKEFKKDKKAWAFFEALAPSYKRTVQHWVMAAKQETTRENRLKKLIAASASGKRLR